MNSRPKKSPSSKVRKAGRVTPCASPPVNPRIRVRPDGARGATRPTSHCRELRQWQASLPTQLERDTLLTPEWVAESVVQEAERFLKADLPEDFAARLAAKAHHLYPRHKHFRQGLNRPGNGGRETLLMFMRHWTAGWLKRERPALYQKLPRDYALGKALPASDIVSNRRPR